METIFQNNLVMGLGAIVAVLVIIHLLFLQHSKNNQLRELAEAKQASEKNQLRELAEAKQASEKIHETKLAEEIAKRRVLEDRFKAVLDIEREVEKLEVSRTSIDVAVENIRVDYAQKKQIYDRLKSELAAYDERLSFAELGVYEPHFDFKDSGAFKDAIKAIRARQKIMVSSKSAVICSIEWSVDDSLAKGKTMTGRNIRLVLRAFNKECEVAIANARWNNINAMLKRITNAKTQIDKLNESNRIVIVQDYFNLKADELRLTHEYRETLKQEKDERAEASRLARDEVKLLRDAAAAQKQADAYEALLDKARKEAGLATIGEIDNVNKRVAALEKELEIALNRNERAQAMAEKTKSGYVYIISNIGSFGDGIIKIGMTRRLEPYDRVRELGDASVPFLFDTHAMIYSEDAPSLEKALHFEYDTRRVNAANNRKEFFKATVKEVEEAVKRLAPDADFFSNIEAQQFHETIAMRKEEAKRLDQKADSEFPNEI